ncbi:T9SS type A sorting domain-containing protein [uncultured Aquimarina sp.]|uniref:leucine-rich repeat domain-containing protein n=1 Tax=uncultured Aquimarina sp. TaxID=575652 RepID=UPI0026155AAD|nr:T9SS type A sorting domain-containing protein [uncultured Aquimarina sp.]
MKKLLLVACLAYTTFSYSQTNLIQNGSFENWTSGQLNDWTLQEGNISQNQNEVTNGLSSALFVEGTTRPKIIASNYILEGGKTYRLSFDYKVKSGSSTFGQQVISYKYGAADFDPNNSSSSIPQNFEWNTVSKEITPTITEEWYFEISIASFISDGFEVYIDNIQIIDVNEPIPDKEALLALYNATDGANWSEPWDLSTDYRTWKGLTFDENGRVSKISLFGQGMNGSIPPEIEDLTELKNLFIGAEENLIGPIPSEIGNLGKLESLSFFGNSLSGEIPSSLGNLSNLKNLFFSQNKLTGEIPASLGNLSQLTSLNLSRNEFHGNIPSEIGNLSNITFLALGGNNFTGEIPSEIGSLSKLINLELFANGLSGSIPSEIGNLINLETLHMDSNNLGNDIPNELGNLTKLKSLSLSRNKLTGNIPSTFGNLVNLTNLNLSFNELEGNIPNSLWSLDLLISLSLNRNNINGTIPKDIGNLINLYWLDIGQNDISGSLPNEIWSLTNLEFLRINGLTNLDSWEIPDNLKNLTKLRVFDASYINLIGIIPDIFNSLTVLEELYLQGNKISGSIPPSLFSLTNLKNLNLQRNMISGPLMDVSSTNISRFYVSHNSLVFEDIEGIIQNYNTNITSFIYSPQSKLDTEEVIILNQGEETTLSVETTQSTNNLYQWRKNDIEIEGATERSFTISNSSSLDVGVYDCIVTNSNVPDLTLIRNKITLNVNVTLGTEDFDNAGIKAYPVPTKDKLVLSLGAIHGEHITASLYGMLGSKVFEQKNLTDNQILDFSNLQSGTYILKLQTNTKTYVSRILKQ